MASKKRTKIVNPPASDPTLTKSPMPFSSTPFTVSPGQPVQPLTTPKLRQIVAGGPVTIIRGKGH